jgi:hypothetical protein
VRPTELDDTDSTVEGYRALADNLIEYGIDHPKVAEVRGWLNGFKQVERKGDEVLVSGVSAAPFDVLPSGYGYKGGVARYLFERELRVVMGWGTSVVQEPRDIDLVRFGRGWTELDATLSRQYMADDFSRGRGVEVISDWSRYASSRDLSVNEVAYHSETLRMSVVAFADTVARIIRPCRYRGGSLHQPPTLASSLAVKMVRLYAERLAVGEDWLVAGIPADQQVTDFDLAVQLNKSLARGEVAAEKFLGVVYDYGWINPAALDQSTLLLSMLTELAPSLPGGIEFFSNAPSTLRDSALAILQVERTEK